jgi:MSHA biogenesis protein MshQ
LLDSPYIGRFYPHHFKLTPGVLTNRVDLSCTTAATFTYLGENLQLAYTLTACNALGAATLNYDDRGGFGRFVGDTLLPATELADYTIGALDDPYGTAPIALSERINIVSAAKQIDGWLYGRADFTVVVNVARLADVDGPFADCYFGICLQDLDGVQIASSEDSDGAEISAPDLDMDQDTVLDHTLVVIDPTDLRYGRMVLENAYGSELLDLPMTMQAEYWTGLAFTRNLVDSCTLFGEADLTLDNDQIGAPVTGLVPIDVGTQTTMATINNQPLLNGEGGLVFSAPGSGGDGWVAAELTVADYLKYNWHHLGDENPRSRATFGIYKGSDRIIFLRETGW